MLGITGGVTDPAAWGAFLTGVAAVLGAGISLRRQRRRDEERCEQRIGDIREAFKAGMKVEERHKRSA